MQITEVMLVLDILGATMAIPTVLIPQGQAGQVKSITKPTAQLEAITTPG